MKKLIVGLFAALLFNLTGLGQTEELNNKFGIGGQLVQYQKDFGVGLSITSPYLIHNRLAIRVKGNLIWNEHIDSNNETTWSEYSNFSARSSCRCREYR